MNLCAAKAKIEYSTFRKMSEQSKAQNNITKASAAVKVLQVARNWKLDSAHRWKETIAKTCKHMKKHGI